MRILLAEDEETIAVTLMDALEDAGHTVTLVDNTQAAVDALEGNPDVVLTDIRMPGAGGMEILKRAISQDARRAVVMMTGYATVEQAVEAMRIGAAHYLQKPFSNEAVVTLVERLARERSLIEENARLRDELQEFISDQRMGEMVGRSPAMMRVFERLRTVAPTDATVLILGESGTGKERVAKVLHEASPRHDGPFVAISCGALPETLLEAELFGHERGAFTDAHKERRGRFEMADGGTLFLDDVDDMPMSVQVKLLRVLQERQFERLGSEKTRDTDIRVVAATKRPLREMVREGTFREDLFYRINVVPVDLPPLRERDGDVPLLLQHLIERHGNGRAYTVSDGTLSALSRYPWPGNVRELENAVQRAIALAGSGTELARDALLPLDTRWRGATEPSVEVRDLREVLRETEVAHLKRALEATGGHRTQTAKLLGISRKVLWEKLRDFGIEEGGDE